MAWEMDNTVKQYIAPSIHKVAMMPGGREDIEFYYVEQLVDPYSDYETLEAQEDRLFKEAKVFSTEALVTAIAERAKVVATVANGGESFYISEYDGGYGSLVEFCDEDETLAYYG